VYLHLFYWPGNELTVEGLSGGVRRVRWLGGPSTLGFRRAGAKLVIDLSSVKADPHVTVLAVDMK
jgi:hypothetical protein